jgi:hypothetical protein
MTQQVLEDVKKRIAALWHGLLTEVSKKVAIPGSGNEYSRIGDIIIPIPSLDAFGIKAETREATEDDPKDGLPLYKDDKLSWLYDAVVAQCKAQARNMLVSGTIDLKDGKSIAETFEALMAEGDRRGNAEALKLAREVQQSFSAFVQTLGKSAQTQAVLVGLFRNRQALSLQTDENKTKMQGYLQKYAETLEEVNLTRYAKYLGTVEEACAPGTPTDF